ncbi:hypothetical protein WA026_012611 [Henosepilachna vigintioctopunctata]|uniref:Uncharacterized protein n=1 Tax=Henosepilachna vigintioctopunctata TaxID=420089 RepID=A0AAW1TXJ6_9CUCU
MNNPNRGEGDSETEAKTEFTTMDPSDSIILDLDIQIEKGRPRQITHQFQAVYERDRRRKETPIGQLLQKRSSLTQPDDHSTAELFDAAQTNIHSTESRPSGLGSLWNQVRWEV